MDYRLGLDVGTNSLGWSVLEIDETGSPISLNDTGVRIFNEGRDPQTKSTLKATRTEKRSARRRRDRFLQRQKFLFSALINYGLFPQDAASQKQLELLDPYVLRHKALVDALEPYHIGRALFHLNQRRGFKSNRNDRSEESTSGVVSSSVRALLEEMKLIGSQTETTEDMSKEEKKELRIQEAEDRKNAIEVLASNPTVSFGSFLYERRQKGKTVRARREVDGKLYEIYPTRELLEDEFTKILKKQSEFHPKLITQAAMKKLHYVIFTQRPLKPQERGQCGFYSQEKRTFRCMPSFQRYRMVQELHALEWVDGNGKHCLRDYPDAKNEILDMMEKVKTQKGELTFGKMKTVLKQHGHVIGDVRFNFESPKRKGFDGNLTAKILRDEDYVGEDWYQWSLEKQDDLIDKINDSALDDDDVLKYLMTEHGLEEFHAKNCMNAPLIEGVASLSLRASCDLYSNMLEHNCSQSDAVQNLDEADEGFKNPYTRASDGELLDALPYYGDAFSDGRHIIAGTKKEEDKSDELKYFGGVTNPTVHIALNQIRQVVNELIGRFGRPSSISIELARDLPQGAEKRKEIIRLQAKNQKKNEQVDKVLEEFKQTPHRDNRLRMALWEELSEGPNGRLCPFSGQKISLADLFDTSGSIEIEHLLPFSQTLDDSKANKTICLRQANRDKGDRVPFEAFSNNPTGYNWDEILDRIQDFPPSKRWRFQEDAMEVWLRDHADFSARYLNDTRYIGRLTREYLENICSFKKIDVVTGQLTALLRGHWGLNSVLRGHNEPESTNPKKLRDDHRHHAIDAIVIAMTTRSMLQKVSTAAGRAEKLEIGRLFPKNEQGHSAIEPWESFRDDVEEKVRAILVSHKPTRKTLSEGSTDGALHNETAFGIISGPDAKGKYVVTTRKPVSYFGTLKRIKTIRDNRLREEFKNVWENEIDAEQAVLAIQKRATVLNIKSLRVKESKAVIPIKNKSGEVYKAYDGNSNWGMEIFEYPTGHEKAGKWEGVVIQSFKANQRSFKPGETYKPHPAAKLMMRLQINDMFEVEVNGAMQIYRVQKINRSANSVICAPLHEANVDARHRKNKNDDPFTYKNFSVKQLSKGKARKIHISPSGKKGR